LKYQLTDGSHNLAALVERLGEAGCEDALAGIGQPGWLALEFTREAADAQAAVHSALAETVGVSRQNMRKLMLAHAGSFPAPVHEGGVGSASIWHLADVLAWLQAKGGYSVPATLLEVAQAALRINIAKEGRRLPPALFRELKALAG